MLQVQLPGRLPIVNEGKGKWRTRDTFSSGFEDESKYSDKLNSARSRSVSTMSSTASVPSSPETATMSRMLFRTLKKDLKDLKEACNLKDPDAAEMDGAVGKC